MSGRRIPNRCRRRSSSVRPLHSNAMQYRDDLLALQALPELDRQTLLGEGIEGRQCAKPCALHELIGHEVHAPVLVRRRGLYPRFSMDRRDMALGALAPQRQSLFAIQPVYQLVVRAPALALEQHLHTFVRDPPDPRAQLRAGRADFGTGIEPLRTSPPRRPVARSRHSAFACAEPCLDAARVSPLYLTTSCSRI